MAGNKKPRKSTKTVYRRKSIHISSVLNRVLAKFHIIGDMNHLPTVFHFADLSMHLTGIDLKIAYQHAYDFLCVERKTWTMMAFHFFKTDEGVEVIPTKVEQPDTTMKEMGEIGEELLKQMRESIYEADPNYSEETLAFYGYYLTYGEGLPVETIEGQLTESFLKITKDLEEVKPHVVEITEEKVLAALNNDKFSIRDRNALHTNMVQKVQL